uniref:Uncharacterized protein n=1 Tax=Coccidioides posadasii RMSCC 3488 TaxID=454284 RepID=A0A0J6FCA1_COCPO|nr:hypothetical protein CPAG_04226 [Coccidioides posadasii RMSCC 3488]
MGILDYISASLFDRRWHETGSWRRGAFGLSVESRDRFISSKISRNTMRLSLGEAPRLPKWPHPLLGQSVGLIWNCRWSETLRGPPKSGWLYLHVYMLDG